MTAKPVDSTTAPIHEPLPPPGFEITLERLSSMSGEQLRALYDGVLGAREALLGVQNQPRCQDQIGRGLLTPAGAVLDELMEALDRVLMLTVDAARDRAPADAWDAEQCAWVQIHHHAIWPDDLPGFAALVSSSVLRLAALEASRQ